MSSLYQLALSCKALSPATEHRFHIFISDGGVHVDPPIPFMSNREQFETTSISTIFSFKPSSLAGLESWILNSLMDSDTRKACDGLAWLQDEVVS